MYWEHSVGVFTTGVVLRNIDIMGVKIYDAVNKEIGESRYMRAYYSTYYSQGH